MKSAFLLVGWLVLSGSILAQPTNDRPLSVQRSERLIMEEKHFAECLAYVYRPALWISYKGSPYFAPKNPAQLAQVQALKIARSRYIALTNREARYEIAHQSLAASGLDENWQKKLLLPYSEENPNLTPTVNRDFRAVESYKIVQTLEEGDVLIEDRGTNYVVMNFSLPEQTGGQTNLYLVKEGERAFATAPGHYQRVEAFTRVGLHRDEISALDRAVASFQKRAAALGRELAGFKEQQEFEASKMRATDSNPYLQYLVARAYLEGKGTAKNEPLGLEWMKKAARNGSGDAKTYLQTKGLKPD